MAHRPRKNSGKKMIFRPPKASSTEVWSVLKKLELSEPLYELTARLRELNVCRAWRESVGESIARRSAATALGRGVLNVVVEAPAWRNELVFIEAEIVRRVNQRYKELLPNDPVGPPVKKLRLSVGALPAPPAPPLPKEKLRAATDDEARDVDARLAEVKDPEVRDAARKFLLASLRAERAERANK